MGREIAGIVFKVEPAKIKVQQTYLKVEKL